MSVVHSIKIWHKTKTGMLTFAAAELLLAYAFVSWAIDSGRLSAWFLAIVLTVGVIQNVVKLAWKVLRNGVVARPYPRRSGGVHVRAFKSQ